MGLQDGIGMTFHATIILAFSVDLPQVDALVEGARCERTPIRRELAAKDLALVAREKHRRSKQPALAVHMLHMNQLLLKGRDELSSVALTVTLMLGFPRVHAHERHGCCLAKPIGPRSAG